MKSNYKKLGMLVEAIDIRNTSQDINLLLGLSIDKCFITSIANVIGTDLTTYKIIKQNQFAVSLMQVSRDEKVPIACLKNYREAIMSPAYMIFQIKNIDEILPEYLDICFKRSEFDREASFIAVGGVRGSMPWEDFCRIKIPVPPIEQQKKIVQTYNTLIKRIELKKQINEKLEEMIDCIYNDIFMNNSSYYMGSLKEIVKISSGGDKPFEFSIERTEDMNIPIYSNGITNEGLFGYTKFATINEESVTITARGNVGSVFYRNSPYVPIVRLISITPISPVITAKYLYCYFKQLDIKGYGTSQQQLTVPFFEEMYIKIPKENVLHDFMNAVNPLFLNINNNKKQIKLLYNLSQLYAKNI